MTKEFRYITTLKIKLLFALRYSKASIKKKDTILFRVKALSTNQTLYKLKKLQRPVFLVNSRAFIITLKPFLKSHPLFLSYWI